MTVNLSATVIALLYVGSPSDTSISHGFSCPIDSKHRSLHCLYWSLEFYALISSWYTDTITHYGEVRIHDPAELREELALRESSGTLVLSILRNGRELRLIVNSGLLGFQIENCPLP
jgi:hypothetical protein